MLSGKIQALFSPHKIIIFFFVSLLFTLGIDRPGQVSLRMLFASLILLWFVFFIKKQNTADSKLPMSFWGFFLFWVYQIIRMVWGLVQVINDAHGLNRIACMQYLSAPLEWSFYLGFFIMSYYVFRNRQWVKQFYSTIIGITFVFSLNLIPLILIYQRTYYILKNGLYGFFPPFFYFQPWVSEYLIAAKPAINWTGDILAVGFFLAISLALYECFLTQRKNRFYAVSLWLFIAGINLAGALLLISRGTVTSITLTFFLYLVIVLVKFPRKVTFLSILGILVVVTTTALWFDVPKLVSKEIEATKKEYEIRDNKSTSMGTSLEALDRSLKIYQDHPLFGIGTDGYSNYSERYSEFHESYLVVAKLRSMSHYLQLLVEEGAVGLGIYLIFLMGFLWEVILGLLKTASRLRFFYGLGSLAFVVMIFGHAVINHILQNFHFSMMTYSLMGVCLGILNEMTDENS